MPDPPKKKPGPDEERLKLEGDWQDAVRKSLQKKPPPDGWPKQPDEPKDDDDKTPD